MFTLLHSTNQELFEKHVCNHSSHYEKYDGAMRPSYHLKPKYPLPSLSAMFDLLPSSTNQELFEKHLCNKSSHYEKYRQFFITQRKPSHATTKLMLFPVSKDQWNTKEDTGKSLKNELHVLRCAKRHLSGWSDVEQSKNQACSLSRYQVTLAKEKRKGEPLVCQLICRKVDKLEYRKFIFSNRVE